MANNASSVLETHPQRIDVINALLAGESTRTISGWLTNPKVSHNAICRYRRDKIKPALMASANSNKLKTVSDSTIAHVQEQRAVTRQALEVDLFQRRLDAKYARYDRVLQAAESKEDYRAVAALDQAETRTMHFQAELEGRLDRGNTANVTNNTVIILPNPDMLDAITRPHTATPAAYDIDISQP